MKAKFSIHIGHHFISDSDFNYGGWSAIISPISPSTHEEKKLSDVDTHTSILRLALISAVKALQEIKTPSNIEIITDNIHIKEGIDKNLTQWKNNKWKRTNGKTLMNMSLWKKLNSAMKGHDIICTYVNKNKRCEIGCEAFKIAKEASENPIKGKIREGEDPFYNTSFSEDESKLQIIAHIDGGCSGNPGPGGWGVVLKAIKDNRIVKKRQLYGCDDSTNSARMELTAAISALDNLHRPTKLIIVSDSKYLIDGMNKLMGKWKRNNWKKSNGEPVANIDLWNRLDRARSRHDVKWEWVKAHNGDIWNERADYLASQYHTSPFQNEKESTNDFNI